MAMMSWWQRVFPYARYSYWDAARNGREDGRKGIPTPEQEKNPGYIMQLKQVAEENIARLAQDWKRSDVKMLGEFCKAKQEGVFIAAALEKAEAEVRESRAAETRAREGYIKYFHMTPFWYHVIAIGIGLLEIPMNSIVFQLFGEDKLFTLLVSLGLALMLPLCGHFLGGFLMHGYPKDKKISTKAILTVLLALVPVLTLVGIAYLREKFFEGAGIQKLLGITMEGSTVTAIFFFFNLIIFLGATVAAYVSHNPDALKYLQDLRAARKILKNAKRRVELFEQKQQQNADRMHNIAAKREKLFESTQNEVKEWRDIIQKLMSIYHTHNQRVRDDRQMPKCFETYPPIDSPIDIDPSSKDAKLDWNCTTVLLSSTDSQSTLIKGTTLTDTESPPVAIVSTVEANGQPKAAQEMQNS